MMKHTNHFLMDKAFTYNVTGYDNKKREYILVNAITKEEKRIPKNDFDEMMKEQQKQREHHKE